MSQCFGLHALCVVVVMPFGLCVCVSDRTMDVALM
jgi:hypothetical protein